jgi:hypothetical protein
MHYLAMQEDEKRTGRPTKYKPEYDDLAFKFCLMGATDARLAEFFEVVESTINCWKLEHPTFSESIKKGREEADANVANSLYNRARGLTVKETREVTLDDGSKDVLVSTKELPPDTAAAFIWLKNRQRWTDRHEVTGADGGALQMHVVAVPKPETRDDWLKQIEQQHDAIELGDGSDSED